MTSPARLVAWYAGIVTFSLPWVGLAVGISETGFVVWLFHLLAMIMAIMWISDGLEQ